MRLTLTLIAVLIMGLLRTCVAIHFETSAHGPIPAYVAWPRRGHK